VPRVVDRDQRVREIADAAVEVLSEGGYRELTLRKLAQRMGGSITLVTHFFPTRDLLLAGVLDVVLADAVAFSGELTAIEDPHERLLAVMKWFLPLTEDDLRGERARLALVAHRNADPAARDFLDRLEGAMRDVLRSAVDGLVPFEDRDAVVDQMRVWGSGMVLSAIEHPEMWSADRQLAALGRFLDCLELSADRHMAGLDRSS
jgi:AcrR family transcriptional regulator